MRKPRCDSARCDDHATLFLQAFGKHGWTPKVYCDRHTGVILRLRGKLIRKYNLNVVVRPITKRDLDERRKRK